MSRLIIHSHGFRRGMMMMRSRGISPIKPRQGDRSKQEQEAENMTLKQKGNHLELKIAREGEKKGIPET